MSTRAVYTFIDGEDSYPVYKHHDGYPSGAAQWIAAALPYAWPLPRFEAAEFAAAFIAGNKPAPKAYGGNVQQGGAVYMTQGRNVHGDLDYAYEIRFDGKDLRVTCLEHKPMMVTPRLCGQGEVDGYKQTFEGTLAEFQSWANVIELIDA